MTAVPALLHAEEPLPDPLVVVLTGYTLLSINFRPNTSEMDEAKKRMFRDLFALAAEFDGDFVFFDVGDELKALVPDPYRSVALERTDA